MKDKREKEQENKAWLAIHDRIQSGNDRADKMKSWLTNRPPIYAQTYADMQARGEIVTERDGKKYRLRFTNAAERNHAPNTGEIHMDLKDAVIFDDSQFRTFAEGSGELHRFFLTLNKADAAEFNEIARKLDIDPGRLIREALRLLARAYSVSPEVFIAESKRCHTLKAQALMRAMNEMDHHEEIEK